MGEIFSRERPRLTLDFTGERLTTSVGGQIEIEHYHRYFLARELCRDKDVLDIASGEGYGSAFLAQVARSVVGVELSAEAVAHAARAYSRSNLHFVGGDVRSIPLRDASVDIVVSFETIEHIYQHDAFIAEVRRVLRPNGAVIISTPDRDVYSPSNSAANPFHVRELTKEEFTTTLRRAFQHVECLLQRPMIGSAMLPDQLAAGVRPPITFERRGEDRFEASEGLPRAVYAVALASDQAIGLPPAALYIASSDLVAHEAELHTAREQVRQGRLQCEQFAHELTDLRGEYQQQVGSSEALRAENAGLERQLADLRGEYQQQVVGNEALRTGTAALERQLTLLQAENQRLTDSGEALRTGNAALERQLADLRARNESLQAEGAARERQLTLVQAENQRLTAGGAALRTEKVVFRRQLEDLRSANQTSVASGESLRIENAALMARTKQLQSVHSMLLEETHRLWSSSSWRLLRPLRNLIRRSRGYDKETEPTPTSEAEALRTVITIRQSLSWELAAPLRIVHRVFFPHRRSSVVPRKRSVSPGALLNHSEAATTEPRGPERFPVSSPAPPLAQFKGQAGPRIIYISGEPNTPGNSYRVERCVEAAAANGTQVTTMSVELAAERLNEVAAANIVVLWRVAWDERVSSIIATARSGGAKVIFDLDDLMIDPELARADIIDGIRTLLIQGYDARRHFENVQKTMLAADFCTATTIELARHMRRFFKTTYVIPNCFDQATWSASRLAVRRHRAQPSDGLVRIGYAAGTRTHQKDFAVAVNAVARVLRERPECRLVLFHVIDDGKPIVVPEEFVALQGLEGQIEWRNHVPLQKLPDEIARFDINLAPLEVGNPFCEAKSELKFFEAALTDVCTVASPTGPFKRAIDDGKTGLLPTDEASWYTALLSLVDDPARRRQIARAAYYAAMQKFGPWRLRDGIFSLLEQFKEERTAARAFELAMLRNARGISEAPLVPESEVIFTADRFQQAEVTVVIPLHNYAHFVEEALESVKAQTLQVLDLIVIDDQSTDKSLEVTLRWAKRNATRFNRIAVLRNRANAGLGPSRNAGFDAAETPYVIPLDADNRLLPECCESCLLAISESGAAFVYPTIRLFGNSTGLRGNQPYCAMRFAGGNYIDAMALVAKSAWIEAGGYQRMVVLGWEDYDFWCRLAERGLYGHPAGSILAEYREHDQSMLHTTTDAKHNKRPLIADIEQRHSWITFNDPDAPLTVDG